MAYSDKVIDHYNNPRNVGQMDKASTEVGTGLVGAPECGDVMRLQIRVNPETNVIEDAKFKTFGCGSAIASSSLATEWVKGKTIDQALAISNTLTIDSYLALGRVQGALGKRSESIFQELPAEVQQVTQAGCRPRLRRRRSGIRRPAQGL